MNKQESVNTFDGGLNMDLNPIVTPNNVVVGALNATSLTYNGNEFVLQNDMGNGEVHTAKLSKGYVPVGMKEHGGIIYVAAYNPITHKRQIGSFPSPQQLYTDADLNITPINIDFSNFFTTEEIDNVTVPFITLEYYKQKLFQNNTEAKIFHPGDKFILTSSPISTAIKQAIANNVLSLRLGVINDSGVIDYIDTSSLRLYSNNLWIYETSNVEDALLDNSLVQVFSAKSSGALVLIVEVNTFSKFNLVKKYSYNELTNLISVALSGEIEGKSDLFTGKTDVDDNVQLFGAQGNAQNAFYDILNITQQTPEDTSSVNYNLAPVSMYGVLSRMMKSGVVNFASIKSNTESFNEWRFFISDTYAKLGWGYDYYNINDVNSIERIAFKFIDITSRPSSIEEATGYIHDVVKDYYNGSFEDIVTFDNIKKNWIYIVEISKYIDGVKSVIAYRLLYTGTLFNEYYNGTVKDFNDLQIDDIQLPINESFSQSTLAASENIYINKSKTASSFPEDYTNKNNISPNDYLITKTSLTDSTANDAFTTKIKGEYKIGLQTSLQYNYDPNQFAGSTKTLTTQDYFGTSPIIQSETWTEDAILNTDNIYKSEVTTNNEFINSTYNATTDTIEIDLSTTRTAYAPSGVIQSKVLNNDVLMPLYYSEMSSTDKEKIVSFKDTDNVLIAASGDRNDICYNARFFKDQAHTDGVDKGTTVGDYDDGGLQTALNNMGNGTVGIFGGRGRDYASLKFDATRIRRNNWPPLTSIPSLGREIDYQDNFLLATWMDTNGKHWIINLASQKTETTDVNSITDIIRVPEMLRCFLSQLCTVHKGNISRYYSGPDSLSFIYHKKFASHNIGKILLSQPGKSNVKFYLGSSDISTKEHMTWWSSLLENKIVDFTPEYYIQKPEFIQTDISIGENIQIENNINILSGYTNAYSYYGTNVSGTTLDKSKIYIAKLSDTALNSDGTVKNLLWDTDGSVVVAEDQTKLTIWGNQVITLPYSINDIFITEYANLGVETELNRILINPLRSDPSIMGHWTKDSDHHAPDMKVSVHFGGNTYIYQP